MRCLMHSFSRSCCLLTLLVLASLLAVNCSAPVQKPTGPGHDYDSAKDMFKRGRFDRALDLTDGLSTANPTSEYTERARVLRAVIYAGQLKSSKQLAEGYGKGSETTKNPHFKAEYVRLRHDNLQYAARTALGLAETAHQLAADGTLPKEATLEASFPTTEGPVEIAALARVEQGGWIEPDVQDNTATDALRKGVDDALADAVAGDRSKARNALAGGSTKIGGADFAIFLAKEIADGAVVFDRKHGRDPQKLKTLCDEGDEIVKAGLALLKDSPDKDKEKELKKLQDKFKTIIKNG